MVLNFSHAFKIIKDKSKLSQLKRPLALLSRVDDISRLKLKQQQEILDEASKIENKKGRSLI
jgi:hypothetical protein